MYGHLERIFVLECRLVRGRVCVLRRNRLVMKIFDFEPVIVIFEEENERGQNEG
jgi:hypothetical protein